MLHTKCCIRTYVVYSQNLSQLRTYVRMYDTSKHHLCHAYICTYIYTPELFFFWELVIWTAVGVVTLSEDDVAALSVITVVLVVVVWVIVMVVVILVDCGSLLFVIILIHSVDKYNKMSIHTYVCTSTCMYGATQRKCYTWLRFLSCNTSLWYYLKLIQLSTIKTQSIHNGCIRTSTIKHYCGD